METKKKILFVVIGLVAVGGIAAFTIFSGTSGELFAGRIGGLKLNKTSPVADIAPQAAPEEQTAVAQPVAIDTSTVVSPAAEAETENNSFREKISRKANTDPEQSIDNVTTTTVDQNTGAIAVPKPLANTNGQPRTFKITGKIVGIADEYGSLNQAKIGNYNINLLDNITGTYSYHPDDIGSKDNPFELYSHYSGTDFTIKIDKDPSSGELPWSITTDSAFTIDVRDENWRTKGAIDELIMHNDKNIPSATLDSRDYWRISWNLKDEGGTALNLKADDGTPLYPTLLPQSCPDLNAWGSKDLYVAEGFVSGGGGGWFSWGSGTYASYFTPVLKFRMSIDSCQEV